MRKLMPISSEFSGAPILPHHNSHILTSLAGVIFLGTSRCGQKSQSKAFMIATITSAIGYGEKSSLIVELETGFLDARRFGV